METQNVTGCTTAQTVVAPAAAAAQATKPTDAAQKTDVQDKAAALKQDAFVKSDVTTDADTGIYSKSSIAKTLASAEERRTQSFVSMLTQMLGKQGEKGKLSAQKLNESIKLNFTQEDIDAASKAIADGGEYSVDAVSTRIMDMAKALAGDDPSKIATLRDAVSKGFGNAVSALGHSSMDDMPSITGQTYDEVMKRFDDWEKSYQTDNSEPVSE